MNSGTVTSDMYVFNWSLEARICALKSWISHRCLQALKSWSSEARIRAKSWSREAHPCLEALKSWSSHRCLQALKSWSSEARIRAKSWSLEALKLVSEPSLEVVKLIRALKPWSLEARIGAFKPWSLEALKLVSAPSLEVLKLWSSEARIRAKSWSREAHPCLEALKSWSSHRCLQALKSWSSEARIRAKSWSLEALKLWSSYPSQVLKSWSSSVPWSPEVLKLASVPSSLEVLKLWSLELRSFGASEKKSGTSELLDFGASEQKSGNHSATAMQFQRNNVQAMNNKMTPQLACLRLRDLAAQVNRYQKRYSQQKPQMKSSKQLFTQPPHWPKHRLTRRLEWNSANNLDSIHNSQTTQTYQTLATLNKPSILCQRIQCLKQLSSHSNEQEESKTVCSPINRRLQAAHSVILRIQRYSCTARQLEATRLKCKGLKQANRRTEHRSVTDRSPSSSCGALCVCARQTCLLAILPQCENRQWGSISAKPKPKTT